MIGQVQNIKKFNVMKSNNALPSLTIIAGPKYTGKSTLLNEFCNIIDDKAIVQYIQPKVEAIREMIQSNDLLTNSIKIYCIENFELLSMQAQSSVLKTFEEPIENCYFIITTNNLEFMLDTILSRGQTFIMQPYTKEELKSYYDKEDFYTRFDTPSKIDYWKIKDLNALNKIMDGLQQTLTKKSIIESYNIINKNITFDINEEGFYYLFFMEEFDKKLKLTYKWQNEKQYNKYCALLSEFYSKTNYITINQSSLLDKLIINLHYIFQGEIK